MNEYLTPETVKNMELEELQGLLTSIEKLKAERDRYKKAHLKSTEDYEKLIWSKENEPSEFIKAQNEKKFWELPTTIDKILFVLKCEDRLMTSREITDVFDDRFEDLNGFWANPDSIIS